MTDQLLNNGFPSAAFYPPNETVAAWAVKYEGHMPEWVLRHVAAEAAQWSADQELEACCEWLSWRLSCRLSNELRRARRPKPPSLKELALERCNQLEKLDILNEESLSILRSALKELPND